MHISAQLIDSCQKIKNTALSSFCIIEKIFSTERFVMRLWRDRQFFFSRAAQTILRWKAVDCWAEICNFEQDKMRKNKKLRRSNLFPMTVFKHGLLEGSTVLFQYSCTSHTLLKISRLDELKYAISAGEDVKLENKSRRKCKNWHCATSVDGHCSMGCWTDRHSYFDAATPAVHR